MRIQPEGPSRSLMDAVWVRRDEVHRVILDRVHAIDPSGSRTDPEYLKGLRLAAGAAIDQTIEAMTIGEDRDPPVPGAVIEQTSLAARRGVSLETVLRRYLAGHAVLADFVGEEAERAGLTAGQLRRVLRLMAARTDRVLATISSTYVAETSHFRADHRRAERVTRLLDGELLDPSSLGYDLDQSHVGLAIAGRGTAEAVKALTGLLGVRRLIVPTEEGVVWAWTGLCRRLDRRRIEAAMPAGMLEGLRIGVGEPASGRIGWRLSHEQALAALSVAVRSEAATVLYRDVAVLAAALKDELLTVSLREMYLRPLEEIEGGLLLTTLRAYVAADWNASSCASQLGVSRNTVANRLRAIEEKIGYLHAARTPELVSALALSGLTPD